MSGGRDTARLSKNAESKKRARRDRFGWTEEEVELLMEWEGGEEELEALAYALERTIEACRQRFYETRSGKVTHYTSTTTTTTTTTTTYRGWMEGDGDGD